MLLVMALDRPPSSLPSYAPHPVSPKEERREGGLSEASFEAVRNEVGGSSSGVMSEMESWKSVDVR